MNRITHDRRDIICTGKRTTKGETFVILFRAETAGDAVRQVGRWAVSPQYSLTKKDAAAFAKAINAEVENGNG